MLTGGDDVRASAATSEEETPSPKADDELVEDAEPLRSHAQTIWVDLRNQHDEVRALPLSSQQLPLDFFLLTLPFFRDVQQTATWCTNAFSYCQWEADDTRASSTCNVEETDTQRTEYCHANEGNKMRVQKYIKTTTHGVETHSFSLVF